MKNGNWIALHKELKYFLPKGRPFTILEAMFSYTLDIDNGKEGTISGYHKLWGWSRTKVRKFITELKTVEGHLTNTQETGKRHQILIKINNLQDRKDSIKTVERQLKDSQVDTTINPNPKPNKKKKNIYADFPNLNIEAWKKWLDYKSKIKDSYKTEKGERAKIKNLINISNGNKDYQDELIEYAMEEEWKGIYIPKEGNNGKGGTVYKHRKTSDDRAAEILMECEQINGNDEGHY